MLHFVQANWYLEWHLDVLILWALANTGEISKAEDLLKGLTSRLKDPSTLNDTLNVIWQCIDC